ncbi:DUF1573 domain-containing protein [Gimesia chilikensis]|uniref:DUF1573 domain-containing protein n=1 Tax=Gimesia chilikensis TaxID=2605989 RepID=UPI0011EFD616|nr:DUF1573 domain-containing protein [Gimesia chilikensis]
MSTNNSVPRRFRIIIVGLVVIWSCTLIGMGYMWQRDQQDSQLTDTLPAEVKRQLIEVVPTSVETGRVPLRSTIKRKIKITNISTSAIIIDRVETTCGCTSASPPKDPILPGNSITITVDVSNNNESNSGNFKHYMYVASKDAESEKAEMVIVSVVGSYE